MQWFYVLPKVCSKYIEQQLEVRPPSSRPSYLSRVKRLVNILLLLRNFETKLQVFLITKITRMPPFQKQIKILIRFFVKKFLFISELPENVGAWTLDQKLVGLNSFGIQPAWLIKAKSMSWFFGTAIVISHGKISQLFFYVIETFITFTSMVWTSCSC